MVARLTGQTISATRECDKREDCHRKSSSAYYLYRRVEKIQEKQAVTTPLD